MVAVAVSRLPAAEGDEEAPGGLREPLLPRATAAATEEVADCSDAAGPTDASLAGYGDQAAVGAAAAAAAVAVQSFPVTLDDLTDEGSERYGSEAAGTPPRRSPSPPPPLPSTSAPGGDVATAKRGGASAAAGGGGGGPSPSPSSTTAPAPPAGAMGLSPRSRRIVVRLSVLFAMDSLAGGLVTGTLLAYYFQVRYVAYCCTEGKVRLP